MALNTTSCLYLLMVLVTMGSGCSREGYAVSGRVILDGEALSNGLISLRPASRLAGARPVSADVEDGRFSFAASQGIKPGSYVVSIMAWRKTGRKLDVDDAEDLDEHEQYLPDKYNLTSKLSVDVHGNTSGLVFELEMPEAQADEDLAVSSDEPASAETSAETAE
jgi:hypothetical protein